MELREISLFTSQALQNYYPKSRGNLKADSRVYDQKVEMWTIIADFPQEKKKHTLEKINYQHSLFMFASFMTIKWLWIFHFFSLWYYIFWQNLKYAWIHSGIILESAVLILYHPYW